MGNPPMSDDRKKKLAADCFRRGTEALAKQNWDYACEMYRQCANLVPENVMFYQSLLGATERRYNNNGTGASMAGMRLMGIKTSLKKSRMQSDWNSMIQTALDGLAVNPWDPGLNSDLGDALSNVGFNEIAVVAFERAVKGDPNNKDYLRSLGRLYEIRENYDAAIDAFTKIARIDKLDAEARQKITSLSAKKVVHRGGYENADDIRQVQRNIAKNTESDGPGMSVQADLERAIRKEPDNKDNYLKLADYLKREGQLEKTAETLRKALEVSGGEIKIREQLEDVELDLLRKTVGFAKEAHLQDTDDKFAERKYKETRAELLTKQIDIFAARTERYPQDMTIKYELALLYMQDKRYQQAIPLLQKARSDARRKVGALLNLGKCFIYEKQYPLARRQFEQAIADANPDDNLDQFLDLSYMAGRVCEELKDYDAAIRHYQAVLEYDYDYKDNRDRLSRLESGETGSQG